MVSEQKSEESGEIIGVVLDGERALCHGGYKLERGLQKRWDRWMDGWMDGSLIKKVP